MWSLSLFMLACLPDPPVAGQAIGGGSDRPVWMFQRGPDRQWLRNSEPVAHGMSSLGLGVDGADLVLTGQCFWTDCGSTIWRHLAGPPVHAIVGRGSDWNPRMWRLIDPDRVPIDTEFRVGSDGAWVWYYGTQAGASGDPAHHARPHRVYRARVDGDRLIEATEVLSGPELADPAPVTFRNQDILFVTTAPGRSIGMAMGYPLEIVRTFDGVSVPHAMVVGDALWLWAHRVEDDEFVPVRSVTTDLETWSSWEVVLPTAGLGGCGNPVGAVLGNDTAVMFCVTEPLLGVPTP